MELEENNAQEHDKVKAVSEEEAGKAEFDKLMKSVQDYVDNKQYDLAQIVIEKALGLKVYADDLGVLYGWAVAIYYENGCYDTALGFVNQAIEASPDNLNHYNNKERVLHQLILSAEQSGQNASRFVENYRITCQVWAKKAKEQQDKAAICEALYCLSEGYCDDEPINYDLAEQYAKEALEYDEDGERGKEILQWLDAPKEVDLEELRRYQEEESPYEEEITALVEQIISAGLKPECELGWVMATKDFHGTYYPNKDGEDEEESTKMTFALSKDGTFIEQTIRETAYDRYKTNSKETQDCSISDVMMEMDFEAYKYHNNGSGWSERSSCVKGIKRCWNGYSERKLTRKYRKKGQALFNRLKEIADSQAAHIEESRRMNEEYEAELATVKEKLAAEYKQKREALISEKKIKVDEAIKSESDRAALCDRITAMKSELSSLGLFSGKRKKELETRISEAEQQLMLIPTAAQIEADYQKKLDDLDTNENREFSYARDSLRKFKYPLPQQ